MELGAPQQRLQPGKSGQHGRRGPVLLLRHQLKPVASLLRIPKCAGPVAPASRLRFLRRSASEKKTPPRCGRHEYKRLAISKSRLYTGLLLRGRLRERVISGVFHERNWVYVVDVGDWHDHWCLASEFPAGSRPLRGRRSLEPGAPRFLELSAGRI
jgi:hypothetical protein